MAQGGIPIGQWSGADATNELRRTVANFNANAKAQTDEMVRLTRTIALLTKVMVAFVGVQIVIAVIARFVAA